MAIRIKVSPPDTAPITHDQLWAACARGEWPAEALSARDREALVAELHWAGWTDVEIATHTRMTTYTTGRIRARLGLAANHRKEAA